MRIVRVAATTLVDTDKFSEESGYVFHYDIGEPDDHFVENEDGFYEFTDEYDTWVTGLPKQPDELAEVAGRLCYKSWDRPNPATATTQGYVANIIKQQHFSVLEHASVTYYVSGVSRSLLTELERHRHFSFSVVSQRYVDHSSDSDNFDIIYPPVLGSLDAVEELDLKAELRNAALAGEAAYRYIYERLSDAGVKHKQAREAARAALPGACATEFLITGNLRAYREMLQKRLSPTADAEIRGLAELLLADLKEYAPASFQDFDD